jgi:hypothetical protein
VPEVDLVPEAPEVVVPEVLSGLRQRSLALRVEQSLPQQEQLLWYLPEEMQVRVVTPQILQLVAVEAVIPEVPRVVLVVQQLGKLTQPQVALLLQLREPEVLDA